MFERLRDPLSHMPDRAQHLIDRATTVTRHGLADWQERFGAMPEQLATVSRGVWPVVRQRPAPKGVDTVSLAYGIAMGLGIGLAIGVLASRPMAPALERLRRETRRRAERVPRIRVTRMEEAARAE